MTLTFVRAYAEAGNIWSFIFEPQEPITWQAGQSLRIEVPGPYGALEHRFTIASAPHAGHIMITTRKSNSDFKQSLFALTPGDQLRAYGLEGTFLWQNKHTKPVLVAAGVGITPFHAMLAERAHRGQSLEATLIYANADDSIAFKRALDTWQNAHLSFAIHYIIGHHITAQHITTLVADAAERHIFLSGPSAMVDDVSAGLLAHGVPEQQLLRDWFTGALNRDG